ncbi:LacI family transcriptional regulator [Cryobacterium glaciale]|uniref:LacI family transcriptional regulator n=1 Tax=Cryobacterium glaciale TaxID=1259145 RepID=A0A4R8UR35_9MICO|nr:LacI family DNA-binding transcriptional regulator [Cryobacterium glaciale]TFB68197.1 LacI family transcriptional regulator [Cryobacterium glaciale]
MTTTIRQVAAAAGVSLATASRALSGSPAVVESTRKRVQHAAAELDYNPNRLGRSLVTGLTGNIGLIFPDISNPFYTQFLAELESVVASRDIGILIGDAHEDSDREASLLRQMATQVDSLVLVSSRMTDFQITAAAARLPVVLANRQLEPGTPVPELLSQIVIDVDPGFSAAIEHLHTLGHQRVTYLDGPARSWSAREKRASLSQACARLGIDLSILRVEKPDFDSGRAIAQHLDPATSVVVAFNDQVALGVLSICRDRGIRVPDHMSVVGCDDSLPLGLAWPALTTIDSSSGALGALAARAVLDPAAHRTGSVPTRLIVRDSTAVAGASAR